MPTIYQNLTELMAEDLVRYSGEQRSTGGRKANGISVSADAKISIGIGLSRKEFEIVATDLLSNVLAYREINCPDMASFLSEGRSLAPYLEQFIEDYHLNREKILGVGAAIPGILTADGTNLVLCPTMNLENISLLGLSQNIPYPFHAENNGTCGGNAEVFYWQSYPNLAYLSLEDGVGGMLFLENKAYLGDNRKSGEFGHMCVSPGGLRCNCGRMGCLEAYCSSWRISGNLGITIEEFFQGLQQNNPEYSILWTDYLQHLAVGINNIHRITDCPVILGGYMVRYLRPYFPRLQEYVASGELIETGASFLHLGIVEECPAPRGAALYFIQKFIEKI